MSTVNIPGRPDLDLRGRKVENIGLPSADNDSANKQYVDNLVAGIDPTGSPIPDYDGTDTYENGNLTTQDNIVYQYINATPMVGNAITGGLTNETFWRIVVNGNANNLPSLELGQIYTHDGTRPIADIVDVVGVWDELSPHDHIFATSTLFEGDTLTDFTLNQVVVVTSTQQVFRVTVAGTGYTATTFVEITGDEEVQNLILNTANDRERADGRWPTTEAWQLDKFALKGDAGGVDITAYTAGEEYAVDDWVYHVGEIFRCTVAYTAPVAPATFGPQNQPEHWASVTENVNAIDTLAALRLLNTSASTSATIRVGEYFAVQGDTDANKGLYIVTATDNSNPPSTGTQVTKLAGLGGGGPLEAFTLTGTPEENSVIKYTDATTLTWGTDLDDRLRGTIGALDHSDTGVTVAAVIDYNDPTTDAPYTIILPSANPVPPFNIGDGVAGSSGGTTYTIVRFQTAGAVDEIFIPGHHASEFTVGNTIFLSTDGHAQNSIWTLASAGATSYTQDENTLNDLLAFKQSISQQVQANTTAIAAFDADLVSIAAYQPQGAYLSGAGDITPSFSTDQVDRSGSPTGTGYANTGEIRVYHDGRVEILTYLTMPEGVNTDGTGTNAPSVDYVAAFEEQFKTEDIIGFALVSGAYNTLGFPHIINTTLETAYDNGHGTGLKAYFLNGIYQGRVEVRFQGQLTPSQNSDRTFITDHTDRTILYDQYTSYQAFPTNAFWHNTRIADPEQIFLIKEGVYLLHEIADAAVPANVGQVLTVTQDQNRVDTFQFPAGSNLSGDLSYTLSRPPFGPVAFSTVAGASITNTGSLVTFDYTGAVTAGSFTATYATTGIEAQSFPSTGTNIIHDRIAGANNVSYVRGGSIDAFHFADGAALTAFLDVLDFPTSGGSADPDYEVPLGHVLTVTLGTDTIVFPADIVWIYEVGNTTLAFDFNDITSGRPAADISATTLSAVASDFDDTVTTIAEGDNITFTVTGETLTLSTPDAGETGIPTVTDLSIEDGTVGEIVDLTDQVTESYTGPAYTTTFAVGAYQRLGNNNLKSDWRKIDLEIAGDAFPTLNLHDERLFYLDDHSGTTNTGWYIYHTPNATRATGAWCETGESIESRRVYPSFDTDVASSKAVEPFQLTSGVWTWDSVVYFYNGLEHNVTGTQDAWDNAPRVNPVDSTSALRTGWNTWDNLVAVWSGTARTNADFRDGGYVNAWISGTETASTFSDTTNSRTYNFSAYTNINGRTETWYEIQDAQWSGTQLTPSTTGNSVWTRADLTFGSDTAASIDSHIGATVNGTFQI